MSQQSLADQAVDTLAKVKAMGENVDNDHPMRHTVRSMQRMAEQMLADAMRRAEELAYYAGRTVKDYDEGVAAPSTEGAGK